MLRKTLYFLIVSCTCSIEFVCADWHAYPSHNTPFSAFFKSKFFSTNNEQCIKKNIFCGGLHRPGCCSGLICDTKAPSSLLFFSVDLAKSANDMAFN